MERLMQRLLRMYGTQVQIIHEGKENTIHVIFYSSNSKSRENMEKRYCPLGQIPDGQYVCILPAGTAAVDDWLKVDGESYRFCRVEDMRMGQQTLYQWSLLTRKGGDEAWEWTE